MITLRLRPAARRDLADIWLFSADNWGVDHAERYVAAIQGVIESLIEFPERHPCHESRHGEFRKAASGTHVVFYLFDGESIDVARVLHSAMDYEAWFD